MILPVYTIFIRNDDNDDDDSTVKWVKLMLLASFNVLFYMNNFQNR
jgi:hypothetical protein